MKLIIYFPKQIVQKSWAQTKLYKHKQYFFVFNFLFQTSNWRGREGGRDWFCNFFLTRPERKSLQYPSVSMKRFLFERNLVSGIWKENRRKDILHCQTQHWTLVHYYFWNSNQGLVAESQISLTHFLTRIGCMTYMNAKYLSLYCLKNHYLLSSDFDATWDYIASSFPSFVLVSAYPTIFYIAPGVVCWFHQTFLLHWSSFSPSTFCKYKLLI